MATHDLQTGGVRFGNVAGSITHSTIAGGDVTQSTDGETIRSLHATLDDMQTLLLTLQRDPTALAHISGVPLESVTAAQQSIQDVQAAVASDLSKADKTSMGSKIKDAVAVIKAIATDADKTLKSTQSLGSGIVSMAKQAIEVAQRLAAASWISSWPG